MYTKGEWRPTGFSIYVDNKRIMDAVQDEIAVFNQDKVNDYILQEGCRNYLRAVAQWS